jgi:Domain of unknown function (DUF4375)
MRRTSDLASWGIDFAHKRAEGLDVPQLPDGVRQVLLITRSNPDFAGIDGWLRTHSGNYALETVDAYLEIGALETAKVYGRALAVFPKGRPPRDIVKREDRLDALDLPESHWRDLEEQYRRAVDTEDLYALIGKYVRRHAKVFGVDEMPEDWPSGGAAPPAEDAPHAEQALGALENLARLSKARKK